MKYLISILAIISLFIFQNRESTYIAIPEKLSEIQNNNHEGKKLMETHCYLCHSPNAAENEDRIAPPMVAIKAKYIDKERFNKAEFIQYFTDFVKNPTKEKVLMYGAVKKHGLMPKQDFPKGSVEKIADFLYDYQIEEPSWFKAHWELHGNKNWIQSGKKFIEVASQKTFSDIGLEYALETKKVLGKTLMGTIQKEGTIAALDFCNVQAMPLTDSMALKYNATIKRVSDKNRNPKNKANAEELKYIAKFKKQMANMQDIKPVIVEKGNTVHFYYPIETNTMCLQCHGKNIKPEVSRRVLKLYPKDLAVNYNESEVRGMWSITFNKKIK
ncbi:cytochrome c553 [Flavobacterium sp. PL11]|jgi:cytochrome c553|uniref:Tll0287-like domain-containing protein n=1 Tax=Flavobacterium sp. PL11 TaxID=3071717 RepID=UPI002E0BA9AF|nr:cytochrome c553 [Flavobacterium sp. PL11]